MTEENELQPDDKKLLELAAKAAGMVVLPLRRWADDEQGWFYSEHGHKCPAMVNRGTLAVWNPLTDDGDLARLESALPLIVMWFSDRVEVAQYERKALHVEHFSTYDGDRHAARRRASVCCAAQIGRALA